MYEKGHEMRFEDRKFQAALQGIDLEEGRESETEAVIRRAEAKAQGYSEEQYELAGLFDIEYEDGE